MRFDTFLARHDALVLAQARVELLVADGPTDRLPDARAALRDRIADFESALDAICEDIAAAPVEPLTEIEARCASSRIGKHVVSGISGAACANALRREYAEDLGAARVLAGAPIGGRA